MKVENILEAEQEAKRFLKRLTDLKKSDPAPFNKKESRQYFYASKEGGALKRASMDLTRALAKFRNDV